MKKYIALFLFILTAQVLLGQITPGSIAEANKLQLVSSSSSRIDAKSGSMLSYNPVYAHKGNTLAADSGYLHTNEIGQEYFEAFGNVLITQPSGTLIYADYLHYDATAQLAKLTGNVKMIDKTSVLTTNFLTYNMRSKIGTYTGGGRIQTLTDTITSQNAYYFENTGDTYFRYQVVVRTPSVKVYTDTMRYNSITKNTYFFGPTNIKGNNQENLYTEKGVYNTATGVANFSKKNLYTEGSKFLKGDSLHYERSTGIGKAFRNVVFVDTLDKFYAYGGKGVYKSNEESILMTEKPYIITVVKNEQDSTSKTADSTQVLAPQESKKVEKKETKKVDKKDKETPKQTERTEKNTDAVLPKEEAKLDSVYMTADTLFSKMIPSAEYIPLQLNLDRSGGQIIEEEDIDYGDNKENTEGTIPEKEPEIIQEDKKDTTSTKKPNKAPVAKPQPKKTTHQLYGEDRHEIKHTLKADSILRHKAEVPKAGHADSVINKALEVVKSTEGANDSVSKSKTDTSRTRIVKAYYNVRLYKSDLQAVADSVYYGMQDSMFRFMGRPMIWAEDSQISADTIYMQIINQKMDNALLSQNAFMVNVVADSSKFNQLKGRKITAFFKNNNIEKLFVDGNAENIVFSVNDKTNLITEMFHDRGGRIKVTLEDRKIIDYITIKKVDQKVYPFTMIDDENSVLPGFIWRPQDRPKSKEDLLNRKRELPKDIDEQESKKNDKSSVKKEDIEE